MAVKKIDAFAQTARNVMGADTLVQEGQQCYELHSYSNTPEPVEGGERGVAPSLGFTFAR